MEVKFMGGKKRKEKTFGQQRQGGLVQENKSGRQILVVEFMGEEMLD